MLFSLTVVAGGIAGTAKVSVRTAVGPDAETAVESGLGLAKTNCSNSTAMILSAPRSQLGDKTTLRHSITAETKPTSCPTSSTQHASHTCCGKSQSNRGFNYQVGHLAAAVHR
jgi:hypothetical protein